MCNGACCGAGRCWRASSYVFPCYMFNAEATLTRQRKPIHGTKAGAVSMAYKREPGSRSDRGDGRRRAHAVGLAELPSPRASNSSAASFHGHGMRKKKLTPRAHL